MTIIKSGTISQTNAIVDSEGMLWTKAQTFSDSEQATYNGNAYNINTDDVSVTNDSAIALLFFNNTTQDTWVFSAFFYLLGNSNITGVDTVVSIYKNPDSMSTGTAITAYNRDFRSQKTCDATIEKGQVGSAFTGGTEGFIKSRFSGVGRQTVAVGAVILGPGNSIGIEMTPPTGNTGMTVQMAASIHKLEERTL